MKLLILTEQSSSSRYWESALPLLREKNIDVSLATICSKGQLHENLALKAIRTTSFNAKKAKDYPKVLFELIRYLKRGEFQVIHASEPISAAISGTANFIAQCGKHIYHRHHIQIKDELPQKYLHKIAVKSTNLVMAVSQAVAAVSIDSDGINEHMVLVAYNGINLLQKVENNEIIRLRQKLNIAENEKVVSIIGRLNEIKGHTFLFQAAQIVAKNLKHPVHIIVVGNGEEEESLRFQASNLKKVKVHFVGYQSNIDLWFSIGDLVAMPSYMEAHPLSAIEAMSCEKPLVASAVGGLLEIVEDGVSGILVPPKDEKALADAILRVFQSPELAKNLGENARKRVHEKFTMEKMVDGWISCYKAVLNK